MEMTIMWEEQVEKAFFLWLADGILRIVLIMYIYDKITKALFLDQAGKSELW